MLNPSDIADFPIVWRICNDPPKNGWYHFDENGWYLFNAARPLSGDSAWEGDWLAETWYASVNPSLPDADRHIQFNRESKARVVIAITNDQAREIVDRYYRCMIPSETDAHTLGYVLAELASLKDDRIYGILRAISLNWTYAEAMKEIVCD